MGRTRVQAEGHVRSIVRMNDWGEDIAFIPVGRWLGSATAQLVWCRKASTTSSWLGWFPLPAAIPTATSKQQSRSFMSEGAARNWGGLVLTRCTSVNSPPCRWWVVIVFRRARFPRIVVVSRTHSLVVRDLVRRGLMSGWLRCWCSRSQQTGRVTGLLRFVERHQLRTAPRKTRCGGILADRGAFAGGQFTRSLVGTESWGIRDARVSAAARRACASYTIPVWSCC